MDVTESDNQIPWDERAIVLERWVGIGPVSSPVIVMSVKPKCANF